MIAEQKDQTGDEWILVCFSGNELPMFSDRGFATFSTPKEACEMAESLAMTYEFSAFGVYKKQQTWKMVDGLVSCWRRYKVAQQ